MLLDELVAHGVVQNGQVDHLFLRPEAAEHVVARPRIAVGADDRTRPALGGPAHRLAQVVKARPDEAAQQPFF